MSIIQIQHLYKTFGTGENAVHALEDISLDIQKGEIFGIIGLSGAGKSTLVRCMNLLERPTSGSVIVENTFALNGMGNLYITGLTNHDYELVLATQMFYTVISLVGALITDLSYGLVDPRVRVDK